MSAIINRDGSIDFNGSRGLLSIEEITRTATRLFLESHERAMKAEDERRSADRVNALRKSCGVEPKRLTLRIKMPE